LQRARVANSHGESLRVSWEQTMNAYETLTTRTPPIELGDPALDQATGSKDYKSGHASA